ncbi:MAG TPA: class II aldolase/adducin family protein, partial [Jatrophihabitantaceae bacterium]|nr:class II aldolase/adducin family protein [Jatrophihabitantaceae bacterium]
MSRTVETAGIGLAQSTVDLRSFALYGDGSSTRLGWFAEGLRRLMIERGYHQLPEPGPEVQVVLNRIDPERARPYRRKSAPTFVVALADVGEPPDDVLRAGYPLLVRALANLCVMVSNHDGSPAAHFVTLEQGTYAVHHDGSDDDFFAAVFERIEPLASSRLVIANEFRSDLPQELWNGDGHTRQIRRAGEHLDALDLLPAAFPIEEILSDRDLRHVKLLYGIGGLSYGNASARRTADGPLGPEFWMSASGVDKSALTDIGKHILLVQGFDAERDTMILSVPPDVKPNRVSVDAIEHWMIYNEHPEVGAILHVHAWMEGIDSTEINYPCGTVELAGAVAQLLREAPDPGHAVVGQRNHGLTITGETLDEILDRIDGKLVR